MSKSMQYAAMVNYFNSLLAEDEPLSGEQSGLLPATEKEQEKTPSLPFKEPESRTSLQSLLDQVPITVEAAAVSEVKEAVATETPLAAAVRTESRTETAASAETSVITETKTVVSTQVSEPVVATAPEVREEVCAPAKTEWQNMDLGKEFSALFFKVAGVILAVPLKYLGGIYQIEKITQMFGKPEWFSGLTNIRKRKVAVVDTARWMMPGKEIVAHEYRYAILLGNSDWAVQCDELIGTRNLSDGAIKWRDKPGARPWLSGIVKNEMCALLHPEELIKMLESGDNVRDLLDGSGRIRQ
ncbi:chemotaxis protein CheW [Succinimonas amylolytica]|uniref:chemotaxis protein CheW n=1 Tax=Succinimonas amylolytica TaxID=83769 RepID=UPI0023A82BCD